MPTNSFSRRIAALIFLVAAFVTSETALAQSVKELFNRTKSSVVVVYTESKELVSSGQQKGFVSAGGLGSGVYVGNKRVITAAHVVQTADKVTVEFSGGQIVNARVATSAPFADVALLELEWVPTSATEAPLGDSDAVGVGDQVYVVGAPYGLSYTLTVGHISGRQSPGDRVSAMTQIELFQTDAAINTGNSGGPMFNMNGEVIGVVSSILTKSGGFEGLGFAVTSNVARKLLFDEATGWSGLQGVYLSGEHAAMLNVRQGFGLLVESVAEGGLGSQLGIQGGTIPGHIEGQDIILGGDILLSVNDVNITDMGASLEAVRQSMVGIGPGSTLKVKILRAGEELELSSIVRR